MQRIYTLHIASGYHIYFTFLVSSFFYSVVPRFLSIVPKVHHMIYSIPLLLHITIYGVIHLDVGPHEAEPNSRYLLMYLSA